jgi:hypothetical protein
MVTIEKEIVLGLFDRVKVEKKNMQELTSNIIAIENNLTSENISKIKQNINDIIASLATYCSDGLFLAHYQFEAERLLAKLRDYSNDKKTNVLPFKPKIKNERLVSRLDDFCIEINAWHPIMYNFEKDDKRDITLNLVINGIKIG